MCVITYPYDNPDEGLTNLYQLQRPQDKDNHTYLLLFCVCSKWADTEYKIDILSLSYVRLDSGFFQSN